MLAIGFTNTVAEVSYRIHVSHRIHKYCVRGLGILHEKKFIFGILATMTMFTHSINNFELSIPGYESLQNIIIYQDRDRDRDTKNSRDFLGRD